MRKIVIMTVGPFVVVLVISMLVNSWQRGDLPQFRVEVRDARVEELTLEHDGVRVSGMAHTSRRLTHERGASGKVWYTYPLFPPGDIKGREIRALVYTRRSPDRLAGFAEVTVEGRVTEPDERVMVEARPALEEKGYTFAPGFVMIKEYDD